MNSVVWIDLNQAGDDGRVLYGGSDFVAWPRLNASGTRLALVMIGNMGTMRGLAFLVSARTKTPPRRSARRASLTRMPNRTP